LFWWIIFWLIFNLRYWFFVVLKTFKSFTNVVNWILRAMIIWSRKLVWFFSGLRFKKSDSFNGLRFKKSDSFSGLRFKKTGSFSGLTWIFTVCLYIVFGFENYCLFSEIGLFRKNWEKLSNPIKISKFTKNRKPFCSFKNEERLARK